MSAVGSILTNAGALRALGAIAATTSTANTLEAEVSSGLAIGSPADNPAGYITAQGFTSQLGGIAQAISNANQGVSLLQTAQGAIGQQIGLVQQLNAIAVQAANGTETAAEARALQLVAGQLTAQVNDIASQTQFNGINLLDGGFNGVQLQVGAEEGETQTLSIADLRANAIGLYHSNLRAGANGSDFYGSGIGTLALGSALPTTGKFSVGSVTINGPTGGTAAIGVTSSTESAASLASAVNKVAGTTGVRAVASNKISAFFAAAKPGSGYAFTLQASQGGSNGLIGTAQSFAAGSTAGLVSQINGRSSATGITASWTPFAKGSGLLNLSQSSGENIALSALTEPGLAVAVTAIYQGHVQLQSSASFSVGNGAAIGLEASSTLTPLSDIDVGTVAGANTAINVVKYALARLGDQAGQLGAAQQALVATTDTLDTSSQNLSSALGVVQDANIPAVSQGLTQAQIAAQAGVAALKSSTALQQSFLSLLP